MRRPKETSSAHAVRVPLARVVCALACTFTGPFGGAPLSAQEPVREIRGVVWDSIGSRGVPNVIVRVDSAGPATLTDERGRFIFRDLPAGEVTLGFDALGYANTERTVSTDRTETLVVYLRPVPITLEALNVRVERVVDRLETRIRAIPTATTRTLGADDLRDLPDNADPIFSLSKKGIGLGPREGTLIYFGRVIQPAVYIDDMPASWEEFRSVPVGILCRIDVLKAVRGTKATLHAYTCDFLIHVAEGRATVSPLMPGWIGG